MAHADRAKQTEALKLKFDAWLAAAIRTIASYAGYETAKTALWRFRNHPV